MFKNYRRGKGRGGDASAQKVPLKGLFSNGVWHCNCEPRLPAQNFQTKNGGKNHGRWFYTCQLPQPKRCDFFLWADEAQSREAAAVLNNSRSEPVSAPQTPSKGFIDGVSTPQTPKSLGRLRQSSLDITAPYTPSKPPSAPRFSVPSGIKAPTQTAAAEESYDWPLSDDEELSKVADELSSNAMPPPETPRKAIKIDLLSTPGKRKRDELESESAAAWPTPTSGANTDIFTTPSTNARANTLFPPSAGLPSPAETPSPRRFKDALAGNSQDSDLATEMLQALQTASISPDILATVKAICNKHALFTHGVIKGRDISRSLIASKNERITELQGEIEGLRAERETNRAVIRHLRREAEEGRGRS